MKPHYAFLMSKVSAMYRVQQAYMEEFCKFQHQWHSYAHYIGSGINLNGCVMIHIVLLCMLFIMQGIMHNFGCLVCYCRKSIKRNYKKNNRLIPDLLL